jgi:hypothetical protein
VERDIVPNQPQFNLETGGVILLSGGALILRAEKVPDLSLAIDDLSARLGLIRWFGRLLDIMYARLHDLPVRAALARKKDIPNVVASLGTAWTWLHWPGGHAAICVADVERVLALLGVDVPVFHWRRHCHRQAKEAGIELAPEFLE